MRQAVRCCTAPHRWGRSSALPCREVTLPVPWGDLRQTFPSILQQSLLSPRRKFSKTSPPPHLHQSAPRAERCLPSASPIQTCFAPPVCSSTSHHQFIPAQCLPLPPAPHRTSFPRLPPLPPPPPHSPAWHRAALSPPHLSSRRHNSSY